MQITYAKNLPAPIKEQISRQPQGKELYPGFLIGVDEILAQKPSFHDTLSKIQLQSAPLRSACLVVGPDQIPSIFAYEKELDLVKTVVSHVAQHIHPHLKTGIDAIWLVYRATKLYDDWKRPDRDIGACLFEVVGLVQGTAGIVGNIYPDLKISDHWANGINFVVKSGKALYQGRTPPINEMVLSSDKRLLIPLKLLKVAGVALDPSPQFQSLIAVPLSVMKK